MGTRRGSGQYTRAPTERETMKQTEESLVRQIDQLASVLLGEFDQYGPNEGEGAIQMAVRVLREQRDELAGWPTTRIATP